MFLLVPAYPGCPGSKAVKRSLLLLLCADGFRLCGVMVQYVVGLAIYSRAHYFDFQPFHCHTVTLGYLNTHSRKPLFIKQKKNLYMLMVVWGGGILKLGR